MKTELRKSAACPKCGKVYRARPALSRTDNTTWMCPDCGIREALESIGVDEAEQEAILTIIHYCVKKEM